MDRAREETMTIEKTMWGFVLLVAVAATAAPVALQAATMTEHVVATIKGSLSFQLASKRYRTQRVARGLSPSVLPHSEYVRMRDGTLLWTTYWDPRLDPNEAVPTVIVRSP